MTGISGKLHYSDPAREGYTLCGRVIGANLRMTSEPYKITCSACHGSHYLDGQLGNMTHAGH
jgi:hypothetical protein